MELLRTKSLLLQLECVLCEWRGLLLVLAMLPEARTEPGPWKRLHGYLLNDWIKEWMDEQTGTPPRLEKKYTA